MIGHRVSCVRQRRSQGSLGVKLCPVLIEIHHLEGIRVGDGSLIRLKRLGQQFEQGRFPRAIVS